ncbi:hypothetical protein DMENIID0001_134590 [Sergentomyia squamirostris]
MDELLKVFLERRNPKPASLTQKIVVVSERVVIIAAFSVCSDDANKGIRAFYANILSLLFVHIEIFVIGDFLRNLRGKPQHVDVVEEKKNQKFA